MNNWIAPHYNFAIYAALLSPRKLRDRRLHPTAAALLIAHDVHAGASSLYLSRVFGQLFLILLRPGFGLFDYVFEYLCDHDFSLSQCLHCRTSRFGDLHGMKGPYSTVNNETPRARLF